MQTVPIYQPIIDATARFDCDIERYEYWYSRRWCTEHHWSINWHICRKLTYKQGEVQRKFTTSTSVIRKEDQNIFLGSMIYRPGSRVEDSGSFLQISWYNFLIQILRFSEISFDRSFWWIQKFLSSGWASRSKSLNNWGRMFSDWNRKRRRSAYSDYSCGAIFFYLSGKCYCIEFEVDFFICHFVFYINYHIMVFIDTQFVKTETETTLMNLINPFYKPIIHRRSNVIITTWQPEICLSPT